MLTLKDALAIVQRHIPPNSVVRNSYAEAQGKYLFLAENSQGRIPTGGCHWTVDKETGACKCERLERERIHPMAKIKGYRELKLEDT